MSSTPSRPSSTSSKTHDSAKKDRSSSSSGGLSSPSAANSSHGSKHHKKNTSGTTEKSTKPEEEMTPDELVDHIIGENNSSISSLDVSEEAPETTETPSKKRKRPEQEPEKVEEESAEQTIKMRRVGVKKCALDVSAIDGDDIHLWLFKVPETMDVDALNGMQLRIGSTTHIGDSEYLISEGEALEYDSVVNIWPDLEKGKMVLGKPFSKLLHVSEAPKASTTEANQIVQNLAAFLKFGTTRNPIAAMNYDETATPELKVRYAPAGAAIPQEASRGRVSVAGAEPAGRDSHEHKKHKEGKHKHKEGKHKHRD